MVAARLADRFGYGKLEAITEEQLENLAEESSALKNFLSPNTAHEFMSFREGKQLTTAAAERADKLIDSKIELFNRPESGSQITARIEQIDY